MVYLKTINDPVHDLSFHHSNRTTPAAPPLGCPEKAGDDAKYTLLLLFFFRTRAFELRTNGNGARRCNRAKTNRGFGSGRRWWYARPASRVCSIVKSLVVDRGLSPLLPTSMFPSVHQIEEVLESLEDIVYASLSAATPDLPRVRETFDRLWDDVSRFGPNLPDIHVRVPGLGDFHVPPPPPPPPPKSMVEKLIDWCQENPWTVLGVGVGAGLLVGYGSHKYRVHRRQRVRHISTTSIPRERRQVVGAYLISQFLPCSELSVVIIKSFLEEIGPSGCR